MPDSPRKGKCWQQQHEEETGMKENVKLYLKCKCKIIQIAFSNYWINFYILVQVYQFNFNYNFSVILVTNLIIQICLSITLCKLYSGKEEVLLGDFIIILLLIFLLFYGKIRWLYYIFMICNYLYSYIYYKFGIKKINEEFEDPSEVT